MQEEKTNLLFLNVPVQKKVPTGTFEPATLHDGEGVYKCAAKLKLRV